MSLPCGSRSTCTLPELPVQELVVAGLDAAEAVVVGADEPEDRARRPTRWVEAVRLGLVRDPDEVERRAPCRRPSRSPCGRRTRTRSCGWRGAARARSGRPARSARASRRTPTGSLMTRGSATIVVCGTETASTLPERSKMLPRSAGMVTVRTRWPTPSDVRWVRSRACRSKSRTPMAANASTITSRMPMRRSRMGGSGRVGSRFGRVVVRGRAGCVPERGEPAGNAMPACGARGAGDCEWSRAVARGAGARGVRPRACGSRRGRDRGGADRARQGCWAPRLGFAFVQSASVSAVAPSPSEGIGAPGT